MNEAKFRRVLELCALTRDLDLLPRGEDTLVGENGCSLSGGQKVGSFFLDARKMLNDIINQLVMKLRLISRLA